MTFEEWATVHLCPMVMGVNQDAWDSHQDCWNAAQLAMCHLDYEPAKTDTAKSLSGVKGNNDAITTA